MNGDKSVLLIGLDPALIDFSKPGYPPDMDAGKVMAGLNASEEELTRLGCDAPDVGPSAALRDAASKNQLERFQRAVVHALRNARLVIVDKGAHGGH